MKRFFLPILAASALAAPAATSASNPNVVVIIADDLGWSDVGYNNKEVKTPHLEKLRKSGTTLTRYYGYPVCSTMRGTFLTGRNALLTGIRNHNPLGKDEHLFPQTLKAAGYQTWIVGKWHQAGAGENGKYKEEYMPNARGFDYFYGHGGAGIDFYKHTSAHLRARDWQRNGKPVVEEGYTTDLMTNDAIKLIKNRKKNSPFYLHLAYNAIHAPVHDPPTGTAQYKSLSNPKRQQICSMVTYLDNCIGKVITTLEQEGLSKDTIVLFLSDNGGSLKNGSSNAPLKGEKNTVDEGGLRLPGIISWPGKIPANKVSSQFVWVGDWFPTLCDAIDVTPKNTKPFNGQNVWTALSTGKNVQHKPFASGTRSIAIYKPPYKLVKNRREGTSALYDVVKDPTEKTNIAAKHSDIVKELHAELNALLKNAVKVERAEGGKRKRGGRGQRGGRAQGGGKPQN